MRIHKLASDWGHIEESDWFYADLLEDYQQNEKQISVNRPDLLRLGNGKYKIVKDGVTECYQVQLGRVWFLDISMFNLDLATLNASEYNHRQIEALRFVAREGLATKEQKDILHYRSHHEDLRRIGRDSFRWRKVLLTQDDTSEVE